MGGMKRPHVVILGAGASKQTLFKGDKYGNELPLMNNLIDVLNLGPILESNNIEYESDNFEEIYSNLYENPEHENLLKTIEDKIYEYFSSLELPDYPTIYDHLVLSLKNQDLIATFNWDPLLFQACLRNYEKFELPRVVFLHGNVAVGYCQQDNVKGRIGEFCKKCNNPYRPTKLLYPIKAKNYSRDYFIDKEWKTLEKELKNALILTTFGYGAPKSDVEAIRLMKEAWKNQQHNLSLKKIEVIDIKEDKELSLLWEDFIPNEFYTTYKDFYDSWMMKHPRKTCEALWASSIDIEYIPDNNIPKDYGFDDLWNWFNSIN